MQLGFLGLGKMGQRMVLKLLEDGHEVIVWNRTSTVTNEFILQNTKYLPRGKAGKIQNTLSSSESIEKLIKKLPSPRVIWLMLPAGDATESVIQEVARYVQKGDIIVDGGNSFYKDTQKRSEELAVKGIEFLGIGVSGGIIAPVNGFPLMVGGSVSAYRYIETILNSLAKPHGGHAYFGKGGAGHYIKMVHNGIEYGMMQALGEGFGILDKGEYNLDLEKVAQIWIKGTIISGFLLDRAKDALTKDKKLDKIVGYIEENKEARWTIELAKKLKVPIQVIKDSLQFRLKSQKSPKTQGTFAAKMVAALRHEFGGHKVVEKK